MQPTPRAQTLDRLDHERFDLAIVGGGASGLGLALDAALRGLRTVLLEAHDFAQGTSSRSTKLLHGGVRYLAQGQLGLVHEALHERRTVLRNAPHLTRPLPFLVPVHGPLDAVRYGLGLKAYAALAGRSSLGPTRWLGCDALRALAPTLRDRDLRGGVRYWDAQFEDARLALALARSAEAAGAHLLNHAPVTALTHTQGRVDGLSGHDALTRRPYQVRAACVINATGVWGEALRRPGHVGAPTVRPSQGSHLVVPRRFWPCDEALLIPGSTDGRVVFVIPWLGATLLGTTDRARDDAPIEPLPDRDEVDFILAEVARHLHPAPTRADVLSAWAGLRPLVVAPGQAQQRSSALSREHAITVDADGLVTLSGGKWTTYRAMASQTLDHAARGGLLPAKPSRTQHHLLVGAVPGADHAPLAAAPGWHLYGAEAARAQALPGAERWLAPGLAEAMVRFAVQHEHAHTVEDVLARRSRLLFLDARAARAVAPAVASILEQEGVADPGLEAFDRLAQAYAEPSSRMQPQVHA